MLIDMHAHTSGISWCCRAPAPKILEDAKKVGIDGIILTNHFLDTYLRDGMTPADLAQKYVNEYYYTKECGEEMGIKVFFGVEVTMQRHADEHVLVYGVDPDFVLQHPELYHMTLSELSRTVHAAGGYLSQAHPLRSGKNVLMDPADLDGVEVNSHQLYDGPQYEFLSAYARTHGLTLTSGGDYHADASRPLCGVYLPDHLADSGEIFRYLQTAEEIDLQLQEDHDGPRSRVIFRKRED